MNIEAIKALMGETTPGIWSVQSFPYGKRVFSEDNPQVLIEVENADFIALSRPIIKELLERVEELEKHNKQLTGETFSDRNHNALQSRIKELERKVEAFREVAIAIDRDWCKSEGYDWPRNARKIDAEAQRILNEKTK